MELCSENSRGSSITIGVNMNMNNEYCEVWSVKTSQSQMVLSLSCADILKSYVLRNGTGNVLDIIHTCFMVYLLKLHPGKYVIFLMELRRSDLGPRHDRGGDAAVSRHARPRPGPHSAPGTLYPAPLSFSISRGKEASEKIFLTTNREPKSMFFFFYK